MNHLRTARFLTIWLILAAGVAWCADPEPAPATSQETIQLVQQDPEKLKQPQTPDKLKQPQTKDKTAPVPPVPPPTTGGALGQDLSAMAPPSPTSLTGAGNIGLTTPFRMLGDQAPLGIPALAFGNRGNPNFRPSPGDVKAVVFVPSVRGFKIAENESVEPVDRVSVSFNYFDNLNKSINERFGADLHHLRVYREFFSLEKTFLDKSASVGLRLPLNSLTADSGVPGLGGSSTDIGDLSVILKYRLAHNEETGDLISAGLVVTAPTGPDAFAGFANIQFLHNTTIQPFLGYKFLWEKVYLHGFFAVDVPTDSRDVTSMYNDAGLGYLLYRAEQNDQRFLTAIIPTIEAHLNTPLNHRGGLNQFDLAGTPDVFDLTVGTTFEFNRRASLAMGFVTPLTGPRPFDFEVLAQFSLRFGGR